MTARTFNMIMLAILAAALVVVAYFAPRASAADGTKPGQWEIWAYRTNGLRADQPNIKRISREDDEPFASKVECDTAITGVRVDVLLRQEGGWRLRCDGIEPRRVR